jgi:hypothetical protein
MAKSQQEVAQDLRYARLGFPRGNPFRTLNADEEREDLGDLFVPIDHFDQIKENRSVIVFAPRGSGKSTLRVYLAEFQAPIQPRSGSFAIELTNFDAFLKKHTAGIPIRADDYVDEIIRLGLGSIFDLLFLHSPTRINLLSQPDHLLMGKLFANYSPELLGARKLMGAINQHFPSFVADWDEFYQAIEDCQVRRYLSRFSLPDESALASLATLIDRTARHPEPKPEALEGRIKEIAALLNALGYKNLVVLIDRIDEMHETANNYQLQVELLEPLIAHLPLMESSSVCFKCFIPQETRDILLSRQFYRRDRLPDLSVTVEWSDERLTQLFNRRIKVFGAFDDFGLYCMNREDAPRIFQEMLNVAEKSPRWLIIAGQMLIEETASRDGEPLIKWEDWEKAKGKVIQRLQDLTVGEVNRPPEKASQGMEPPAADDILVILKNKPVMKLRGQLINLTETEMKILNCVAGHKGSIHEDQLINLVWEAKSLYDAAGPAVIDSNLNRIRAKIDSVIGERGISKRQYLIKRAKHIELVKFKVVEDL